MIELSLLLRQLTSRACKTSSRLELARARRSVGIKDGQRPCGGIWPAVAAQIRFDERGWETG